MAKLDNIIALGAALSGSKGDVNNLMNQLPGALAQIHIANEESAKEEKRYNDVLEMEVQKNIKEEKRYNIALDSEILKSLGSIADPNARKVAYSNYVTNSDVGAQIKNAGVTGADSQITNTTVFNNEYNELKKIIRTGSDSNGNSYTEDDKESKIEDFKLKISSNPYQGPRFDSLLSDLNGVLGKEKQENAIEEMVSIHVKDPAQSERYAQILLNTSSPTILAQVLKDIFPPDKQTTLQEIQNLYKIVEILAADPDKGIKEHSLYNDFRGRVAKVAANEAGFTNLKETVSTDPEDYSTDIVGKTVEEHIEDLRLLFIDVESQTDEEIFKIAIENGQIKLN